MSPRAEAACEVMPMVAMSGVSAVEGVGGRRTYSWSGVKNLRARRRVSRCGDSEGGV